MSTSDAPLAPSGPIVCFDGDCGLCRASVVLLQRAGLVPAERCRPVQSMEGELSIRLMEAGAHNEIAVWDEATDRIESGSDGLLWALEGSWATPLVNMIRPRPVRALLRFLYRIVAYNRRAISPVRPAQEGMACACDPDYAPVPRWSFIAACAAGIWALQLTWTPHVAEAFVFTMLGALPFGLRKLDHPSTWVSHVAWIGLVTSAVLAVIARFWEQPRLWFLDLVPLLPIAAVLARSLHLRLPKGAILATVLFMALFGAAGQLLFAPFR